MTKKAIAVGIVSLFVISGLLGMLLILPGEVEAPGPTYVSGIISTDTVWTVADSPYNVIGNILIEQYKTLTIEPGVEVRFDGYYYILVEGKLIAEGNENSIITFTSNKSVPTVGDWDHIKFEDCASNDSIIKYCEIEYADRAIDCHITSPTIINNMISNNNHGIYTYNCYSNITNNVFYNNNIGIRVFDSMPQIKDNTFTNNAKGIECLTWDSDPQISRNVFTNNEYGIYCSESSPEITFNTITNNTKGIFCYSNDCTPQINNNTISDNDIGIYISVAAKPDIKFNNIQNINYNVYNDWDDDIVIMHNWWGTIDTDLINQSIYDFYDDFALGKVIYMPFLTSPVDLSGSGLQEGAPWPMFRGNVRHTGLSPYDTSGNTGELKWSFETTHFISSSPAIGSDETIYFGSCDCKLYAFNPYGIEKWNFSMGDFGCSSPAIAYDGSIYIGASDMKLYAVNPNGSLRWSFNANSQVSSPAIGSDGTIYLGSTDHNLYAINPNGTEKWNFTTDDIIDSSPAIGPDGTIYIGSDDNKLYAIYPNGTEKWNFLTGNDVSSTPAIDSDDTIYIGSDDNKLYAIYPNGTEKWKFTMATKPDPNIWDVNSSPAIGSDGTIYAGSIDYNLYAINSNGTEKWNFTTNGGVASSPAIGSDGTIYVGSSDGKLYAIGTPTPNQSPSPPTTPSGPTSVKTNTSYSFSTSTTDPDGDQIKYGWDWDGDGTADEWSGLVDSGTEDNRTYSWSIAGVYNVKVKVQDEFGEESGWSNALSVTITSPPANQPPSILATVPNQIKTEDSAPWTLDLTPYEVDVEDSGVDLKWYLTDIDTSLYSVIGMNSSDDVFTFIPIANVYGNDEVVLCLEDSEGANTFQILWINITSVNDIPYFDPSPPDLFIDYDSPYSFNYTSYVHDIETPNENLILTTSEPTEDLGNGYAEINGLNISFYYPQSRAGELILINITLSDGEGSDNESIEISIAEEQPDYDNDGIPDSIDEDDDNDGHNDEEDYYPKDPTRWSLQTDISIAEITLSKYGPSAGEEVIMYVEIQNTGNNDCDVIVKYYDGDPDDGGTQIGTNHEITILSDSYDSVTQSWIATAGNHTLYVIVEDLTTGEEVTDYLPITVGENIQPVLVLTTGDINIYRFEPGQERTISVEVTCYRQDVSNVRLVVLDDQNLTIDNTITPSITMTDGQTTKFYLRIKAPQLPEGVDKLEKDILIQAVGDNGIFSNAEELDIVVSESAISLFDPFFVMGAVATGSLATLGAAAAASRRDENWKYLLLLTFAVPLYTRIHGKKTLDNFVRGQVYGHIQSKPGTHFNDIKKTLRVGNGNLAYHLRKLEKEGFIKSSRDKRYRRFYPVGVEVVEDEGIKLSQTQESILDYIEQHPKANQKEIAKEIKESQQTISYNLNVLVREGFLTEEKFKGTKRYEIIEENT